MHPSVKRCLGKVIVSCQAYEDTPLYGSEKMKIMAQCALMGGAEVIRACWGQDIQAIRSLGNVVIIGLNKVIQHGKKQGEYIMITPTLESAKEVVEAKADILALDCTLRPYRGKAQLTDLLRQIKQRYPDIAIMADCATLEEGIFAEQTGLVDIISTTLSHENEGPDFDLVQKLKQTCKLPINGEGRVWEVEDLHQMILSGADMVTMGTAITRPHLITERFILANQRYR